MHSLLTVATKFKSTSKYRRPSIDHRPFQSPSDSYAEYIEIYARDRFLQAGRVLHAHLIISALAHSTYLLCKLVAFYTECGRKSDARRAFDQIPESNIRRWNVLIGACSRRGFHQETVDLVREMRREGLKLNKFILPSILRACANLSNQQIGKEIHGLIFRSCCDSDIFVDSALVHMYSKCGHVEKARHVFDRMGEKDLVAWNAIVSGYGQQGFPQEAFYLVEKMQSEGVKPNLVTWNSLISGFSQVGNDVMVWDLFRSMQANGIDPDVVSWTSVISGFVQSFRNKEAFDAFKWMVSAGIVPSSVTISSLLPACSTMADFKRGKEIHAYALVIGVEEDIFVGSSLVDMYAKCGFIFEAEKLFDKMSKRSTVTWNSMIFGYANHGYCNEAIEVFYQMVEEKADVDHLSFTAALTACSHVGMVKLGQDLFHSMQQEYGIQPRLEHYACMVDLLGRVGKLAEAYDLIMTMPMKPDAFVWGALLGACRTYRNIELAGIAAMHLAELEPGSAGSCLLLSNLYADVGSWGDASRLKRMMKRRKLIRTAGCSWIEIV